MKRCLLLAVIACGIAFHGCGSSPDPTGAETVALIESVETPPAAEPAGPWKVRLTVDGEQGKPDANGLYCVFDKAVSTNPLVSFTLDDALGRFESAVVTIREVINGVVALDGIFVSDFAAAEEFRLRPGRPFLLLNPGPGVIVGKGESVDIRRLKAGCTYQLDLVVQGSEGHETLPARFTTR